MRTGSSLLEMARAAQVTHRLVKRSQTAQLQSILVDSHRRDELPPHSTLGLFLQAVITFFLIVWLLFIAISAMGKLRDDEDIDKKVRCRYCMFYISRRVRAPP